MGALFKQTKQTMPKTTATKKVSKTNSKSTKSPKISKTKKVSKTVPKRGSFYDKLTASQLKLFLGHHGLKSYGSKAELIAAMKQFKVAEVKQYFSESEENEAPVKKPTEKKSTAVKKPAEKKLPVVNIPSGRKLYVENSGDTLVALEYKQYLKLKQRDPQAASMISKMEVREDLVLLNLPKHHGEKALKRMGKLLNVNVEKYDSLSHYLMSLNLKCLPSGLNGVVYGYGAHGKTRVLLCRSTIKNGLKVAKKKTN